MKRFFLVVWCAMAIGCAPGGGIAPDKIEPVADKTGEVVASAITIGMQISELIALIGEPDIMTTVYARDLDGEPVRRYVFDDMTVFTRAGRVVDYVE